MSTSFVVREASFVSDAIAASPTDQHTIRTLFLRFTLHVSRFTRLI